MLNESLSNFACLCLTYPTPGIESVGLIEVCDQQYEFCVSNHRHSIPLINLTI